LRFCKNSTEAPQSDHFPSGLTLKINNNIGHVPFIFASDKTTIYGHPIDISSSCILMQAGDIKAGDITVHTV